MGLFDDTWKPVTVEGTAYLECRSPAKRVRCPDGWISLQDPGELTDVFTAMSFKRIQYRLARTGAPGAIAFEDLKSRRWDPTIRISLYDQMPAIHVAAVRQAVDGWEAGPAGIPWKH